MPQQRVTWHELSDEARLFAQVLFEQDVTRPSGGAVMAEQQEHEPVREMPEPWPPKIEAGDGAETETETEGQQEDDEPVVPDGPEESA